MTRISNDRRNSEDIKKDDLTEFHKTGLAGSTNDL